MADKFRLDDRVTRTVSTNIPAGAHGVVLGPAFRHPEMWGLLYPVKWFGHPNFSQADFDVGCPLPDCKTRDHWHSREAMLIKEAAQ